MTVNINTTFQGVNMHRSRVRGPIVADDVARIAKDQGQTWEKLTNRTAAGGGGAPATNTPHVHNPTTEPGNALYWPLMSQQFGSEHVAHDTTTLDDTNHPATIDGASDMSGENLWVFPVRIPVGWAGETFDLLATIRNSGDLRLASIRVTLLDSSMSVVSENDTVPFCRIGTNRPTGGSSEVSFNAMDSPQFPDADTADVFWAGLVPATAGLHAVKITAYTHSGRADYRILDLSLVPRVHPKWMDGMNAGRKFDPTRYSSNTVAIGDGNDWHEIDSLFYTDDCALDAAVTLLAGNDALMQELLTGLPAEGNSTLTVARGHDHGNDGAGSLGYGKSIEFAQGSWCFGTRNPHANIRGNNTHAPVPINAAADTAYKTFTQLRIQNPRHGDTSVGASRLYWTGIAEHVNGTDTLGVEVTFGSYTATGSATAGSGFQYVTVGPFAYTSGAEQDLTIKIRDNGQKNSSVSALVGACFYYDIA